LHEAVLTLRPAIEEPYSRSHTRLEVQAKS